MPNNIKDLVIFLIPPEEIVSGGIMSIFSLCKESRTLLPKNTEVAICTYPGTTSYKKNSLFTNNEIIQDFSDVINKLPSFKKLTLHIPEYAITTIISGLIPYRDIFMHTEEFTINILNQNMELMPPPEAAASLYSLFPTRITQTTAHRRYTTQDLADAYNTPLMNLSVFIDPTQYSYTSYSEKENIIAYSNDDNQHKEAVLSNLKKRLGDYQFIEIKNLSYEEYKKLIARSKYIITFGEGFDGYLIEGIFSGGITFAVYSDTFFPSKDFTEFENIYENYDEMLEKIYTDINIYDEASNYREINNKNFVELSKIYNRDIYISNLKNFYKGRFDYLPNTTASRSFLGNAIIHKDRQIDVFNRNIYNKDTQVQSQAQDLHALNLYVQELNKKLAEIEKINRNQAQALSRIKSSLPYKVYKKLKSLKLK